MRRNQHKAELRKAERAIRRGESTRDAVQDLIAKQADHGSDPDLARQLLSNVEGTLSKQRELRDGLKADDEG